MIHVPDSAKGKMPNAPVLNRTNDISPTRSWVGSDSDEGSLDQGLANRKCFNEKCVSQKEHEEMMSRMGDFY